jgi:hypothetical protein
MDEQQYVALPKLYGAPAYARPSRPVEVQERPLDPDDLPLEAFRGLDEPGQDTSIGEALLPTEAPPPAAVERDSGTEGAPDGSGPIEPRPFSLKALAARIRPR